MLERDSTLDKYRILQPIAAGGMGVVYKAEHIHLRRLVAIKVLLPNYALDERTRARFAQEAYVQGQLSHPNIVEVTDFIHIGDVLAFVMRFVDGPSLEQVLQTESGPWPLDKVLQVLRPVVEGVAYAHARGVVHRDLKPANVLLDATIQASMLGTPRITDFGLAKVLATTGGVTRTGSMLGTVPYMAPEQFAGRSDIDARADVFALSMMFRRMLTGALPVDPNNMIAVTEVYTGRGPLSDPDDWGVELPHPLAQVLRRAASIDPSGRPTTAAAFLRAMEARTEETTDWQEWNQKTAAEAFRRGQVQAVNGRTEEAARWFATAVALAPEVEAYQVELGRVAPVVQAKEGQDQEANPPVRTEPDAGGKRVEMEPARIDRRETVSEFDRSAATVMGAIALCILLLPFIISISLFIAN